MPVSVLLETIAPTVSAIVSERLVPFIVSASVSSVPSTSTLPEMSKLAATTSPTVMFGVPVNPVEVPDVF